MKYVFLIEISWFFSFHLTLRAAVVVIIQLQVFTSIFAFECIVKLMAGSKDFFQCGWNIFDLIVVSLSIVDIGFEQFNGLNVLRVLRLVNYYFQTIFLPSVLIGSVLLLIMLFFTSHFFLNSLFFSYFYRLLLSSCEC